MGICELRCRIEAERHKRDEAFLGLEEPKLARRRAGRVADDLLDESSIPLHGCPPGRPGERLQMRPDGGDLRYRLGDLPFDLAPRRMRVLEAQVGRELE